MAAFAVAVATGDIIKYPLFVYGSFVWGIHVRYNNAYYYPYVLYCICFYRTSACVCRMSENCKSLVLQDKCNIEIFLSPAVILGKKIFTLQMFLYWTHGTIDNIFTDPHTITSLSFHKKNLASPLATYFNEPCL